nr:hypothetical protein Iba_chr04fCG12810 [Ipomoea batatas]
MGVNRKRKRDFTLCSHVANTGQQQQMVVDNNNRWWWTAVVDDGGGCGRRFGIGGDRQFMMEIVEEVAQTAIGLCWKMTNLGEG